MKIEEKLLSRIKINNNTQCWEWTRGKSLGYGHIVVNKKNRCAHRVSYEAFIGEIPYKMVVCHKCDNRRCINPDHLFLRTYLDNYMNCKDKGRLNFKINMRKRVNKSFPGKIIRIKRAFARNKSIEEIAVMVKMTIEEITDIRDKKIYADIGTSIEY